MAAARGRSRAPRRRAARGASAVGRRFEVEVGPFAHGGHAVARVAEPGRPRSRVVFVRHAIPGERVLVEVTEGSEGDAFWRADAVAVLEAAPDRVTPPCPLAGPGRCGGCDLQHVSLAGQRALKTAVVREQLVRLAGLAPEDPLVAALEVQPVTTGDPLVDAGLRWRTRTRFVPLPDGGKGLHRHRSHEVVRVEDCLITLATAQTPALSGEPAGLAGETSRLAGEPAGIASEASRLSGESAGVAGESAGVAGSATQSVTAAGRTHALRRAAGGFWQPHVAAPQVLVEAVLDLLRPQPGEAVLDLYAGVGLFARFLADAVGDEARLVLVEGDRAAAAYARENLGTRKPGRTAVTAGDVGAVLAYRHDEPFDLVVLDPPRSGAKRQVVAQVAARAPRAIAYVACDPAALARDLASFAEHGYRPRAIRAYDLFPMTHHVECVALLDRRLITQRAEPSLASPSGAPSRHSHHRPERRAVTLVSDTVTNVPSHQSGQRPECPLGTQDGDPSALSAPRTATRVPARRTVDA